MVFSTKVTIKPGTVIGGEDILPNGNRYHFFKGIPFAEPPLGELRFKAPVPLEKFSVPELECIKEGPNSVQQDRVTGKPFIGSEDCLYLNVFTPECESNKPLPVMLYIHGGGFNTGNGNSDKHNPLYLLQEGVVVVTFNYRLGVLGCLSLPEAGIPGNAGMKDQVLAMNWVQENIAQFNGDPTNVTLFGHSTGSVCVHMHLFTANCGKLFHRGIMQSGVSIMPSMLDEDGVGQTRHLAKLKMVFSTKVTIKPGTVIGGEDILPNGNRYHFFKGIPFAEPPLGELRFKAPVPLEKFSVPELECIKEGPNSVQQDRVTGKPFIGSEDCLYLNVFTPECESNKPLPVMLYIHGGGFNTGNGNSDKHNPLYLLQEGVVVVTFNYRLGVLGCLSLPEAGIPGNAGMKDQVLAMNWVQENIAQFNGDPTNVTLFGHSTGSVCVHMHLFTANCGKLFHRGIMQSGVSIMPSMLDEDGVGQTRHLAKLVGCTSDDANDILKYLQNFENLEEFVKPLIRDGMPVLHATVPTKPVIEAESPEAVITKSFFEAICQPDFVKVPVLMGYTSVEGLGYLSRYKEDLSDFENDFCEFVPPELNLPLEDPKRIEIANSIKEFYFKGEKIDEKMIYQLGHLIGDYQFSSCIRQAAKCHTRFQHKSPLYFYRFDFDGQLNLYKIKYKVTHLKGASHVDDLCHVFQMEFGPPEPWEEEAHKMVVTFSKLWTNFAKYSNPTPTIDKETGGCIWEPVPKCDSWENMTIKTLILDKEIRMMDNPDEDRLAFWRDLKKYHL
ncbi:esterase B1-like [Episyrphus balteatus]|uniref:esterase B1-like n=1 Tax=Episyrphus balteatus TaxID=286459 RepID=UPI002484F000|nr:esterase B1-like [Episyrphus balteatus]